MPRYIQDEYSLLGNDVAITEDMTLTEDLGTLTGNGRDVTIYGNGHTLDLNFNNGVNVANDQTLSFNNVTLKIVILFLITKELLILLQLC